MKNLIIVSIVIISLFLQGCPGESFDVVKLKTPDKGLNGTMMHNL